MQEGVSLQSITSANSCMQQQLLLTLTSASSTLACWCFQTLATMSTSPSLQYAWQTSSLAVLLLHCAFCSASSSSCSSAMRPLGSDATWRANICSYGGNLASLSCVSLPWVAVAGGFAACPLLLVSHQVGLLNDLVAALAKPVSVFCVVSEKVASYKTHSSRHTASEVVERVRRVRRAGTGSVWHTRHPKQCMLVSSAIAVASERTHAACEPLSEYSRACLAGARRQ